MKDGLVPNPDYDDPKEVYAFFGLAFYRAQVLEQGIVNLAVALHAKGVGSLTMGDVLDLYHGIEGKTFGSVLNAARKLTSIPAVIDADLEQARLHRNRLAHVFFVEHSEHLLTAAGRRTMIDELRIMLGFLIRVDEAFDEIWMKAWSAVGVTQSWFDREFEKIRQQALADKNRS